jgi:general secretion pathway protein G
MQRGLTLIELMLAVLILGLLVGMAVSYFGRYVDRANNTQAVADIGRIEQAIESYNTLNFRLPASLADINLDALRDPWGRAYRYQPFLTPADLGSARKDKKLHPINTDYDLYSAGKDGMTQRPLTAAVSEDDIVRANNGGYVGLASDY